MGIRDSLSRLKERFDPKSRGRRHKPDDTGSGTDGEGVGPADSLSQPVPHVAVGGDHDGGVGGSNADGRQVRSRGQLPRPAEPEPAPSDRDGGERDVGGGEVPQEHSHSRPDVEVAVESGPDQKGHGPYEGKLERVYPSPSFPSIPHRVECGGM